MFSVQRELETTFLALALICIPWILVGYVGCIAIFLVFAIWAFFTISIMVVMEGLSAFLHTLDLHWVEFFTGSGNPYTPFSSKYLLKPEEDD
ncbi:GL23191 [Drosophila persimilis]|uniref:V-type proton ATPase subunit a n=1 Tax=Drosophila persimilis TaxID=7234 RepID=B4G5D5_DROPE|nr:GL23191 [Drosophila persimilis]